MTHSGLIRRIDDLGRVVIPTEVRKRTGIHVGDPFEILYDKDGVYFKKYYTSAGLIEQTTRLIDAVIDEDGINDDARAEAIIALRKAEAILRSNTPT